jgi:NAD(P)-dependent dehydrogenase (short-subunit alcohol dehydrogenase family)
MSARGDEAGGRGPLAGRVALITGANKGIGLEVARQLGQLGVTVLLGARDPERGRAAEAALRAEGVTARALLLDVTDAASIETAAAEVEADPGRLDILVNNAGINAQRAVPSELSLENLRKTFETNFFGAFAVTQRFLPLLRRAEAGRIVNVSTALGSLFRLADPQWQYAPISVKAMAYAASKASLNVLTITLARELAGTAVKVNSVEPGYTATDFNQHRGTKKPEDSVKVIVRYSTLPADGPTGGFFDEHGEVPW